MRTQAGRQQAAGTIETPVYLPHSSPRVHRKPADRLTSGYQETLSCFCRDRRLSSGAKTPNFRRRRRRLARQMGVTCDRLGRACATLLLSPNPLSGRAQKTKMAATLVACHAVLNPGPDGWASGKDAPEAALSAGAVGGLACAPRGWAPRGEAAAPPGGGHWPFLGSSRNKVTHAASKGSFSWHPSPPVPLLIAAYCCDPG